MDSIVIINDKEIHIHKGLVTTEVEFPGGNVEIGKFIQDNIKAPKRSAFSSKAKVYIQFVVTKDGSVSSVTHVKGDNCPECVKAAIEVVKLMPKWRPAMFNGDPVNRLVMLPIAF